MYNCSDRLAWLQLAKEGTHVATALTRLPHKTKTPTCPWEGDRKTHACMRGLCGHPPTHQVRTTCPYFALLTVTDFPLYCSPSKSHLGTGEGRGSRVSSDGRDGGGWQLCGGSSLHSPRVLGIHCTAGYRFQGVEPFDKAPTASTRHTPITTTH